MVSHFESRPAAMYPTQLHQNKKTGELTPVRTRPLDLSAFNGGWVHGAGSVSPWGTHLGSEEYPPDSKQWRDGNITPYNAEMVRYFPQARGAANAALPALALQYMNPYDYGFVVEVDVKNYSHAEVMKHYSMGRVAIELSYVMPNMKTVYISDDGSRVGLFRYEADKAGDLGTGTLYAAKWNQTSTYHPVKTNVDTEYRDGGAANIEWIELGHATDAEIRAIIDSGVTFADIFHEDVPGCMNLSNRDSSDECLLLKPGMEKAAAFIEDADGALRPQTHEELAFCVRCHGGVGTTRDGIFSFARKIVYDSEQHGWYHWSQHGVRGLDDPVRADGTHEYAFYLEQTGAGDEFRANTERLLERSAGRLDVQYLVGLTLAETVAAVRALPEDAVVIARPRLRPVRDLPRPWNGRRLDREL